MNLSMLAVGFALLAAGVTAQDYLGTRPAPKDGFSYPALYCTNRGERVEVGEFACIRTNCCPSRGCDVFTARCGLSTNVTTWRRVRDGCAPAISLDFPAPPAMSRPARG